MILLLSTISNELDVVVDCYINVRLNINKALPVPMLTKGCDT
jgi:hypothetical protein